MNKLNRYLLMFVIFLFILGLPKYTKAILTNKVDKTKNIKVEIIFINGEKRVYNNIVRYWYGNNSLNLEFENKKKISIFNADVIIEQSEEVK